MGSQSRLPEDPALADVLPATLEILCLRDDLVDNIKYEWIDWDNHVHPHDLKYSFALTADFWPFETAMSDYILDQGHCLKTLHLKTRRNRLWPSSSLDRLATECSYRGVELINTVRTFESHYYGDVRSTIIVPRPGTAEHDVSAESKHSQEFPGVFFEQYG